MVKKRVFQKSLKRTCFEDLAEVLSSKLFFACFFYLKRLWREVGADIRSLGLKFFSNKNYESGL